MVGVISIATPMLPRRSWPTTDEIHGPRSNGVSYFATCSSIRIRFYKLQ